MVLLHRCAEVSDHKRNLRDAAISIALGLLLAIVWGVTNVYTVLGFLLTFAVIPAWVLACLGVFRLFWREHRTGQAMDESEDVESLG